MAFAEGTAVPVERSRAEIERVLAKHGAAEFVSGWQERRAWVAFRMRNRLIRFVLTLPDPTDSKFTRDPRSTWKRRTAEAARKAYDAEVRRLWRALLLVLRAKLEVVESGIASFDEEFLAHIVLPDTQTVGELLVAQLDQIAAGGRLALPGRTGGQS